MEIGEPCIQYGCTLYYQSGPIGCVTGATHAHRSSEGSVMNNGHGCGGWSFARGIVGSYVTTRAVTEMSTVIAVERNQ
jgi:hypothetical protein